MKNMIMTALISGVVAVAVTLLVLFIVKALPVQKEIAVLSEPTNETQPVLEEETQPDAKLEGYANILDYGADPKGDEDCTDAIKAAIKDSKLIYFPKGTYLIEKLSIPGSVTLQGAGSNATILKTSNLTGNVLTFKNDGWHVKDLKLTATAYRTGGAYIYSSGNDASIENVSIEQHYVGFDLDGAININITNTTARGGTPHSVAEGGAAIRLGNNAYTGQINIRGMFAWPAALDTQPSTAITMKYVDVVSISDALLIGHTKDVLIAPHRGQFAALIEVTNSCFDTATSGLCIEPTEGGRVLRNGFSNIWFGAHSGDGMVIDGTDGTVPGAQFTNCMFMGNGGDGVNIFGEGVDGIYFSNCFSSSNVTNGLTIAQKAQNVVWNGGVIGASHEAGDNRAYGYYAEEGCSGRIVLTDLRGNTLGAGKDVTGCITLIDNTVD